jgi:hypothetical protein
MAALDAADALGGSDQFIDDVKKVTPATSGATYRQSRKRACARSSPED